MRLKKIVLAITILFVVAGGGYISGKYLFKDKEAKAASPVKGYKVKISNEDWGKIQQIETEFGYQRSYYADYKPYKDQHFLAESSKNQNSLSWGLNSSDKALREKSLDVKVGSITMLGYDKKGMIDNATYEPATKTLYVQAPRLQMAVMIEYKDITHLGIWTKWFNNFTPEQIDAFHEGAQKEVEKKYKSKKEIQNGYDYTNRVVKKEIMNTRFSFPVKKVVFIPSKETPKIINDEIKIK